MRRITGWALIFAGIASLFALAVVPWRAPWWTLLACVMVAVIGVVALVGAGAARYCADCNVRMPTKADRQDKGRS